MSVSQAKAIAIATYNLAKNPLDNFVLLTLAPLSVADGGTGAYSGITFTVKASADGTNYSDILAITTGSGAPVTGGSTISPSDSTNYTWQIPNLVGFQDVQINVTGYTSGTGVFTSYGFSTPSPPFINTIQTTGSFTNILASGTLGVTGASTLGAMSATSITGTGTVALTDNMTITDAKNIVLNATTGTKIGTATTQKLGFYNATPIVQPIGTTDIRTALINLGFIATGGASPLNLNGGALTSGTFALTDNMTVTDAKNIVLNATTGTKIGTATTQKLAFYNATPVVQPAANTDTTTGAAGGTTTVFLNTTYTGGGTAAYTVGGVVAALKAVGILAP